MHNCCASAASTTGCGVARPLAGSTKHPLPNLPERFQTPKEAPMPHLSEVPKHAPKHALTSVAHLHQRLDALLPEIAAGAAERERERQLPYDAIRQLAAAGLYTVRIPLAYGGPGGSVS